MKIKFNDVESFRSPDSFQLTLDDRQQRVEVFGGSVVQDLGRVEAGDTFYITALFSAENFNKLWEFWTNRTLVTFTDEAGNVWENCRIVLKSCKYQNRFPDFISATFEIWRV